MRAQRDEGDRDLAPVASARRPLRPREYPSPALRGSRSRDSLDGPRPVARRGERTERRSLNDLACGRRAGLASRGARGRLRAHRPRGHPPDSSRVRPRTLRPRITGRRAGQRRGPRGRRTRRRPRSRLTRNPMIT
ncbi:MAG: hypothetical protein DWI58_08110 [Chloroflexi bacterium]|nr:MAG: hypothetical protein DWI58_08110 [Chloroflexota bacterium]